MLFYYLLLLIINHQIATINSITYVSLETDNIQSNEEGIIENDRLNEQKVDNLEDEEPPEPPTKVNYEAPGKWAKPPLDKNISLDFIPSKTYAQVRGHHSIKRLPQYHALLDATTDEERDNAGRLRAVVSKKKVNTVYTEEGYEDAAYDHGAQERDANFHEGYGRNLKNSALFYETTPLYSSKEDEEYEDQKNNLRQSAEASIIEPKVINRKIGRNNKKNYTKTTPREWWPRIKQYPRYLVEKETLKLEKDVKTNDSGEIEESGAPNNLDDVVNDSSEYSEEYAVKPKEMTPKLMNITNYGDTTTIDYGKIYWEFFKTEKPEQLSSIEVTTESHFLIPNNTVKSLFQSSEEFSEIETSPTNLNVHEAWSLQDVEKKNEESFSQNPVTEHLPLEIGEKKRKREMNNTKQYLQSMDIIEKTTEAIINETEYPKQSKIIRDVSAIEYSGANTTSIESSELKSENVNDSIANGNEENSQNNLKKPEYTVIIRPPSKPCGELTNESKFNPSITSKNDFTHHLIDNIDPNTINTELIDDTRVIKPPFMPPLGEITYADYIRRNPCVLDESPSPKTINQSLIKVDSHPIATEYSQPQPRPQRFPRLLSWLPFMKGNHLKKPQRSKFYEKMDLTRMLPPSPLSSSQYSEFSTIKDDTEGSSIVADEDIGSNGNQRLTKLSLNRGIIAKSHGLRKKRKTNDLLNDAPSIIDSIINREIELRFPDKSKVDEGNHDESTNEQRQMDKTTAVPQIETEKSEINMNKYPFYNDKRIAGSSTLRYILNPLEVPKKTHGGMEFYNSRDEYLKCDDVDPDLSQITPEEMEIMEDSNVKQQKNVDLPRLHGLGEKLSCFKAKYFDKKPLDNPLFIEERIDTWQPLEEFDLQKFKANIPNVSNKARAPVYHRVSKKPEFSDLHRIESKNNPSKSKFNRTSDHNSGVLRRKKLRRKPPITNSLSPYENQIYEDVMDTIKNLAHMKSSRVINKQDSSEITGLKPPLLPYNKYREQLSSKPPRIHKRNIDSNEKSLQQPIYTIHDRIRFSKPREFLKYDKFTTEIPTTVKTRRKEPRYSNPTEKSDEYLYTTPFEKQLNATVTPAGAETTTETIEYQAVKITEKITESPKIINESTSELSNSQDNRNNTEKVENDESNSEYEEDSHSAQMEKSAENPTNESQESVESYSNEEENVETMSEAEKSFERFSGRPFSPAENYYDPKYAHLGPRINKPAFYHPPFNPPLYESHRGKHYESHEDGDKRESGISSKYAFPWDESENSGESRSESYHFPRYRHPWKKSERLSKRNGKIMKKENDNYYLNDESNEDQLSSETGLNFQVLYPLERWRSLYEKNYAKKRFKSSEFLDSDEDISEYHKNESKINGNDVENIAKSIMNFLNVNINETSKEEEKIELTTVTPQIPPTSSTLIQKVETTTPIIQMTTQRERQIYTVKPRHFSKKIIMEKFKQTNSPVASESTIIQITSRPNTLKLIRNSQSINSRDRKKKNNESSTPKSRRRRPMRTTTTTTTTTTTLSTKAIHTSRSGNSQRQRKSPRSKLPMTTNSPTKANEYQSKLSTSSKKDRYPSISSEKETKETENISLLPPLETNRMEGSEEINSNIQQLKVKYIKEPDQRFYTYVEDISE